jgi:preprotein translocase subunit YajC
MSVNDFVALILAVACFAGFILALDARKRKALQEQIDELKKK